MIEPGTGVDLASDPIALLAARGQDDYIGEPVSQLEHALQAAALASQLGGPDSLVVAALFHDIGHLWLEDAGAFLPGLGVVDHEEVGARFLERAGFPRVVSELVRGHVEAKRYLVATKPAYAATLSEASQKTLEVQGGPFDRHGVQRFETDPLFRDKLRLRSIDERAKVPGLEVPGLAHYAPLIARVRQQPGDRVQETACPTPR